MVAMGGDDTFTPWVALTEPRIRRALLAICGPEVAADATADAFEYAWLNWKRVGAMTNPAGYTYRVARSRIPRARRKHPVLDVGGTHTEDRQFEPALPGLLAALPERQRVAVFLIYGCQWTPTEVGELLGISASTVRNHASRALERLRRELEVTDDA